jgi:hypothetical protein
VAVPPFTTVALSGRSGPSGRTYLSFTNQYLPAVNQAGEIVFSDPEQMFLRSPGASANEFYASNGQALINSSTEVFVAGSAPVCDDSGNIAVIGNQNTPLTLGSPGSPSSVRLIAAGFGQVPGLPPGTRFNYVPSGVRPPVMTRSGLLAFSGYPVGSTGNYLFAAQGSAPVQLITGYGRPAAGVPGATMGAVEDRISLNNSGVAAYRGWLNVDDGSAVRGQEQGVWTGPINSPSPVALYGQMLLPGLVFVRATERVSINSGGDIAAEVSRTDSGLDSSVVKRSGGSWTELARYNTQGPGMTGLERWSSTYVESVFRAPLVTDNGMVTFAGGIRGGTTTDGQGVWRGSSSANLINVVRSGTPLPGAPGVQVNFIENMVVNNTGDVVMSITLQGAGVVNGNDYALTCWSNGVLSTLLRRGDLFEVAPGDLRTINSFSYADGTAGVDGLASALNDAHSLVFQMGFTDGSSGIFTTTVPGPAASVVLLGGAAALSLQRRRARLVS